MSKRAKRKKHYYRLKEKVKWYYKYGDTDHPNSSKTCGVMANTRKFCSCPICCGNPRKTVGRNVVTRQESINNINFEEQLNDYYNE